MVGVEQLREIESRKRLLRAQSEIARRSIQLEWAGLRTDTAWVGRATDWMNRYRSVLLLLAVPVGGVLVVKRGKGLRRLLLRGFAVWQLLRKAGGLMSLFKHRKPF
jgi:hypothetical protein